MILMESLANEAEPAVRRGLTQLISNVAKYTFPQDWPNLVDQVMQLCTSPNPVHRECGLRLVGDMLNNFGTALKPHYVTFYQLFQTVLADPSTPANSRGLAIRGLGNLLMGMFGDKNLLQYKEAIPLLVISLRGCLEHHDEDTIVHGLEIFNDMSECSVPILEPYLPMIIQLMFQIAGNTDLEVGTRTAALDSILFIAEFKPKSLKKHKLDPTILELLFPILAEPEEEYDEEETTVHREAARLLEGLATATKTRTQFFNTVMALVSAYIAGGPYQQKAAIIALSMISQPCGDQLIEKLDVVLPVILGKFAEADPVVVHVAGTCLSRFSQNLQPEIIEHHQQIIPCLFHMLDNPSEHVKEQACSALAAFCNNLENEIVPYVPDLVPKLLMLMNHPRIPVQDTAVTCLASTASAAQDHFLPFMEQVLSIMQPCMAQASEDRLTLRARATDCVGQIAAAVGRQRFEPYFQTFMDLVLDGFKLNYFELRECSFLFFSNVSEILQTDFSNYLHVVVPLVASAILSNEGFHTVVKQKDQYEEALSQIAPEADERESTTSDMIVKTAFLEEKVQAVHCLGAIAENTGASFMMFMPKSIEILQSVEEYFNSDVRGQVVWAYSCFVKAALKATVPNGRIAYQQGFGRNPAVPEAVLTVSQSAMNYYLTELLCEPDYEVAVMTYEAMQELIDLMGPAFVEPYMEALVERLKLYLKRKAECQDFAQEEEGQEEDDDEDADQTVLGATLSLIAELAKVGGASFDPVFQQLAQEMLTYLKPSKPLPQRMQFIGGFAEILDNLGAPTASYCTTLAPLCLQYLTEEDDDLKRNAAFCYGVLVEHGGLAMTSFYQHGLQVLHPMFTTPDITPEAIDNAVGAVARMILVAADKLPLAQILPLFFEGLPLKADFSEFKSVFRAVNALWRYKPDAVMPFMAKLIAVVAQTVAHKERYEISEDLLQELSILVKSWVNQFGAEVQNVVASLPAEQGKAFMELVQRPTM
eukprot:GILJ01010125.1.p1 GENE.GILJ01010125.1~~GILJ01010125.1.p1  ORF type:complete len:1087 (-),score=210.68 GILJ01010125.1:220-3180(-)